MKVKELTAWLENKYPAKAAEHWDNVGLLVGDDEAEVSHVFLALDLTEETLEEAIQAGADMIITHHPMIFSGIKKINNHDFTGRKIMRLIQNHISYYAMHTNYDVLGMADLSADYLKLEEREVLSVTEETRDRCEGLGRVGMLPKQMSLRECGEFVKAALSLNDVKIYGDLEQRSNSAQIAPRLRSKQRRKTTRSLFPSRITASGSRNPASTRSGNVSTRSTAPVAKTRKAPVSDWRSSKRSFPLTVSTSM